MITIRDDARTHDVFPFPFDDEGVSTRPVDAHRPRRVRRQSSTTRPTALQDGVASTGHSLPQPNTWGPLPRHVAMDAGDTPWQEMVGSVSRGLYITRFWYVRDVHPLRTVITGMTREGTFLIENGSITRPGQGSPLHAEHRRGARRRPPGEPRAAPRARRRRIRGTVTLVAHRSLQLHVLDTSAKVLPCTRSPLIGLTLRVPAREGTSRRPRPQPRVLRRARERRRDPARESARRSPSRDCASSSISATASASPVVRTSSRRSTARRRAPTARSRWTTSSIAPRCCSREWALDADKPLLAICRGAQVLNVALGGTLWQDVGTQGATEHNHSQDGSRQELTHNIDVAPHIATARHRRRDARRRQQHASPGAARPRPRPRRQRPRARRPRRGGGASGAAVRGRPPVPPRGAVPRARLGAPAVRRFRRRRACVRLSRTQGGSTAGSGSARSPSSRPSSSFATSSTSRGRRPGLYVDEASIGYNAWTIAHFGVDEHGIHFPLFFEAFGEYKNPIYVYASPRSFGSCR